jgi:hypothetical protein
MKIELRITATDDKKTEVMLGKIDISQHIDEAIMQRLIACGAILNSGLAYIPPKESEENNSEK